MRFFHQVALFCTIVLLSAHNTAHAKSTLPAAQNTPAQTILTQFGGQDIITHTLAENQNIIVLDMPSLAIQGAMFNRIVALIERAGASREEVMTDAELNAYITETGRTPMTFTFGNDLRSSEFSRFFNLAERDGISLNAQETALLEFLIDNQWLRRKYGFIQANKPDRVILSIPFEHTQPLGGGRKITIHHAARKAILLHELGHGEYYTNAFYADYCRKFWYDIMSEQERQVFRNFLGKRSYDTNNEELMINEMQAYLMHTPFGGAISPQTLGMSARNIQELKQKFIAGNPPTKLSFVP